MSDNPFAYTFDHAVCEIDATQSMQSEEFAAINVSSIFSNPSNYPLNFTIIGHPYGAVAEATFGVGYIWGNAGFVFYKLYCCDFNEDCFC